MQNSAEFAGSGILRSRLHKMEFTRNFTFSVAQNGGLPGILRPPEFSADSERSRFSYHQYIYVISWRSKDPAARVRARHLAHDGRGHCGEERGVYKHARKARAPPTWPVVSQTRWRKLSRSIGYAGFNRTNE